MRARNQSNCRALIKFFNDTPDNFFENIRDNIYASTWKNNNELGELFKKHTAGEFQIPGIKYAFFTKLFFFFSKDNTLPILDKWLLTAYVFLLKNEGNTTLEEINYNMNFLLTKKKENAYCLYVRYMNEIANSFHIPLNNLETFLFGWPYNKKNTLAPYLNPRITYKNYFKENS
jgi:hypothetical protein